MDIFCTLTVKGEEVSVGKFVKAIYVEDNLWPPFDLNPLVPRGSRGPAEAWGSPCGALGVHCSDTTARPLVLKFESRQDEPGELVRRLSEQHSELVFALEFFAEHYWFFGWTVFLASKICDRFCSPDPYLFRGLHTDHAFRERELEHPEVALIDGVEATEWGERYMAASRAICRRSANAVGLADEVRETPLCLCSPGSAESRDLSRAMVTPRSPPVELILAGRQLERSFTQSLKGYFYG